MDPRIIKFIKEHHVLTLATSKNNTPWTSHCFYAFLEDEAALVFTTDDSTRHGAEMLENSIISGGIVLETKVVGKIRGIQLTGKARKLTEESKKQSSPRKRGPDRMLPKARKAYLKRFPFAVLMKTSLWVLELESIKFTDNRLGFGKKLYWERS